MEDERLNELEREVEFLKLALTELFDAIVSGDEMLESTKENARDAMYWLR